MEKLRGLELRGLLCLCLLHLLGSEDIVPVIGVFFVEAPARLSRLECDIGGMNPGRRRRIFGIR